MVSEKFYLRLLTFVALLTVLALSVDTDVKPAAAAAVAVTPSKAKQFLASLKRSKRNLWDRSRPDVQQWIQQFMYMGFDEARFSMGFKSDDCDGYCRIFQDLFCNQANLRFAWDHYPDGRSNDAHSPASFLKIS
ncbi:augurin [Pimephales promelas]|nr:augurin [Pimephales promelas]